MINIRKLNYFPTTQKEFELLNEGVYKLEIANGARYFINFSNIPKIEFVLGFKTPIFYRFSGGGFYSVSYNRINLDEVIMDISPNKEVLNWLVFNLDEFR